MHSCILYSILIQSKTLHYNEIQNRSWGLLKPKRYSTPGNHLLFPVSLTLFFCFYLSICSSLTVAEMSAFPGGGGKERQRQGLSTCLKLRQNLRFVDNFLSESKSALNLSELKSQICRNHPFEIPQFFLPLPSHILFFITNDSNTESHEIEHLEWYVDSGVTDILGPGC